MPIRWETVFGRICYYVHARYSGVFVYEIVVVGYGTSAAGYEIGTVSYVGCFFPYFIDLCRGVLNRVLFLVEYAAATCNHVEQYAELGSVSCLVRILAPVLRTETPCPVGVGNG